MGDAVSTATTSAQSLVASGSQSLRRMVIGDKWWLAVKIILSLGSTRSHHRRNGHSFPMLTGKFPIFSRVSEWPKDSVNRFVAITFKVVTVSPQLPVLLHRTSPKLEWPMRRFARGKGGETHQTADGGKPTLTTQQGTPVSDDQNSLRAGDRGPTLLEDFHFREKIFHFDHERIPGAGRACARLWRPRLF